MITSEAIEKIKPGIIVILRPDFGNGNPIKVTAISACTPHKGKFAFDYSTGTEKGLNWAYTSQVDAIEEGVKMKCTVCGQESYHDKYCSFGCEQQAKKIKTYANWKGDLSDYLQVGDIVDDEMHDYFLEVLPPAFWSASILQMGEPYSHREFGATYATLKRTPEGWAYCGHCYRGKTEEVK